MAVIVGVFLAKLLSPVVIVGGLLAGWFARSAGAFILALVAIVAAEEIVLRAVSLTRSYAAADAVVLGCLLAAVAAVAWSSVTRYFRRRRAV